MELEPCYYCGLPATGIDHVIPQALLREFLFFQGEGLDYPSDVKFYRVPSCKQCNSALGSRMFRTMADRRQAVKDYLQRKYAKLLRSPDWSEDEMAELGKTLRSHIRGRMALKTLVRQRIAWPRRLNSLNETALFAATNLLPDEPVESSAHPDAASSNGQKRTAENGEK